MKHEKMKKLTVLAMLSAIAYVAVALLRFPVVLFLSYEPKDVVIAIGGFLYGPLAALGISLVVSFIEMLTISSTGWIGFVMNFLSSAAFAGTAALLYRKKRTQGSAIAGLFGGALLKLIRTPTELLADSKLYLDIYIAGLPFMFYYNVATGIFSAMGDSKTPFIFLACSSTANIGMDILFVHSFSMGVAGVAWATFICQGVSCILAVAFVLKRLHALECENRGERVPVFSWHLFGRFAEIAVPSILQQSFISVGNIIIQSVINNFGAAVMAGYSSAVKLNNMVTTSLTTLGNGISSFTAQNLGAAKPERIKAGFAAGLRLVFAICVPLVLLYFFAGRQLVYVFLESPTGTAADIGMRFLRIISPFYLIVAAKLVADGVLRGAGMMKKFMVTTFSDLTLRVALAAVLSKTALGTTGIWLAWPIGWTIATALSLIFYGTADWKKYVKKSEKSIPVEAENDEAELEMQTE